MQSVSNFKYEDLEIQLIDGGEYITTAEITTTCGDKIMLSVTYSYEAIAFSLGKIWDKSFGGFDDDELNGIKSLADGGFLLFGYSSTLFYGGSRDFWVIKVDDSWSVVWQKSYGGNRDDIIYSVAITDDGDILLGGASDSPVSGNKTAKNYGISDFWLVKIDTNSNKLWDKSYGGNLGELITSIFVLPDGGAILGGFTESPISGNKISEKFGKTDAWIVRIDSKGNKLWDKSFGGSDYEVLNSTLLTKDGGILFGGASSSGVSGNKTTLNNGSIDLWLVKLNALGSKVWEKSFGGVGSEEIANIIESSDGNFILGGSSSTSISGLNKDTDFILAKVNSEGNLLWEKQYGGSGEDKIKSIILTTENNYLLAGFSNSPQLGNKKSQSYGKDDYWILKIDSNGNKLGENTFGGEGTDIPSQIITTSKNEIFIGGTSNSLSKPSIGNREAKNYGLKDFWIVKIK
jgi:hypothetical protein